MSGEAGQGPARVERDGGVVTVLALVDPVTNSLAEPLEFLTHRSLHDDRTFNGAAAEVNQALAKVSTQELEVDQPEATISRTVARHLAGLRAPEARSRLGREPGPVPGCNI